MADDFRRKAVASVIGGSGGCFHEAILTHCSATFQVDNIRPTPTTFLDADQPAAGFDPQGVKLK
jgi:hypothetical protein